MDCKRHCKICLSEWRKPADLRIGQPWQFEIERHLPSGARLKLVKKYRRAAPVAESHSRVG